MCPLGCVFRILPSSSVTTAAATKAEEWAVARAAVTAVEPEAAAAEWPKKTPEPTLGRAKKSTPALLTLE